MALKEIPVLPENHPLYDWSDFQSSRDALAKGTPTAHFAKEAWNAIVDSLNDALTAAGFQWEGKYTTVDGAKITAAYGVLTAQKFNSIRHNIEWPAPLGWAWADREEFRGYVGRENFLGRATHGRHGDLVYPEYIIELVRKLNLLLELMRGTALIEEAEAQHMAAITIDVDVQARRAAPVSHSMNSRTTHKAEFDFLRSAPAEALELSSTQVNAEAFSRKAVEVSPSYVRIPYVIRAEGRTRPPLTVEPEPLLAHSTVIADAIAVDVNKLVEASACHLTGVHVQAELHSGQPLEIGSASMIARSTGTAEIVKGNPLPISGKIVSTDNISAEVAVAEHLAPLVSRQKSKTAVACEFDTAWLPPMWVDDGLWIRQVHNTPKQKENGELEVS